MTRFQIVLVIGAVLVTCAFATSSRATLPGTNGRITFMRKDSSRHWQVWVAGPHLESARELTDEPADSGWPVWSPDGMKLAFDSSRTDANPNDATVINDVFTMNPDGSAVAKLTDSVGASADAAWSPDGSLIAFDADRGDPTSKQGVYVMKPDGSDVARVTTRPAGYQADLAPRFAPDGRWLVFTRYRGSGESEKAALYVVRLDGTGLRRLTTFAIHAGDADWSPDGKRIVFEAYPSPRSYGDVWVVGVNGRGLRNLTRNTIGKAGSADPVWSPDGTRILFLDNRVVRGKGRSGLATMKPDGTHRRFLSPANVESHQPDWQAIRS